MCAADSLASHSTLRDAVWHPAHDALGLAIWSEKSKIDPAEIERLEVLGGGISRVGRSDRWRVRHGRDGYAVGLILMFKFGNVLESDSTASSVLCPHWLLNT
jgi:hypothetical protein